jgi:hypothetical protein
MVVLWSYNKDVLLYLANRQGGRAAPQAIHKSSQSLVGHLHVTAVRDVRDCFVDPMADNFTVAWLVL